MRYARPVAIGAVAVALGVAVLQSQPGGDSDRDGGTSTPYEAACDMLNDGDTRQEAFDVLVRLDVADVAASRAVNEAANDGCG